MTTQDDNSGMSAQPSVSRRTMIAGAASGLVFAESILGAGLQDAPTAAATAPRISADDRADIIELYARIAWGMDLADSELMLSTLAEDVEFDHLWQGKMQGHAAFLKGMEELWYDRQTWWYGRQHLYSNHIMERHPEGIKVRCFFQILQFNVEYGTNFVFAVGTREDLCVQRNGRWVFKSVFINAWRSQEDVPWKGKITMKGRQGAQPSPPSLPPGFKAPR